MYGGHVGIALAAKGYRSTIPLWVLIIATQLPDWADAAECTWISSAPSEVLSHSLPAVAVLAAVGALLYYGASRDFEAAGVVALVVVSHMVADYATGFKPTWPNGPYIGLHLYRKPALDFILEATVIVIGWIIYRRRLPFDRRNSSTVTVLLVSLLLLQLAASLSFSLYPGFPKC